MFRLLRKLLITGTSPHTPVLIDMSMGVTSSSSASEMSIRASFSAPARESNAHLLVRSSCGQLPAR